MADIYGSIAEAAVYHTARGNDAWAAATSDTLRETALLRASEWLDATYRARFPGWKTGRRAQVREWPRSEAEDANCDYIPPDEIPAEVRNATYEAALRELESPGSLSPDFVAAEQIVSETVGPVSTTYRDSITNADVRPVLNVVDNLLAGLIGDARAVPLFGNVARG